MGLPQLTGQKCTRCQRKIGSIAEGVFCGCGNPVHTLCHGIAADGVSDGACTECGGDPNSSIASEVRATREVAKTYREVYCPQCGTKRGLRPYRPNPPFEDQMPQVMIVGPLMMFILFCLALWPLRATGQLECTRCGWVFRPPSRVRTFALVALTLLIVGSVVTLVLVFTWK